MERKKQLVQLLLLAFILSSCAYTPSALNETVSVSELRHDYLQENPEGRFNQYIERGQLVKGMKFTEVMASWGLPESRRLSHDGDFEYWTFYGKDLDSGNWMRYTLVFEKSILTDWDLIRHFATNGTLEDWVTRNRDPLASDRFRVPVTEISTLKR